MVEIAITGLLRYIKVIRRLRKTDAYFKARKARKDHLVAFYTERATSLQSNLYLNDWD